MFLVSALHPVARHLLVENFLHLAGVFWFLISERLLFEILAAFLSQLLQVDLLSVASLLHPFCSFVFLETLVVKISKFLPQKLSLLSVSFILLSFWPHGIA